jgi:16S rRNA (uracil1498-N3)-methyltransferase
LSEPAGFAAGHAATALVYLPDLGGTELSVGGADGHHLQRVRRIEPGETVVAADGAGHWVPCTVVAAREGVVRLAPGAAVHTEPTVRPGLAVAFTPAKGDHAADVVRALVELGVDRIVPFESERSVVRWRGERGARAVARLRRVAREAALLARRARLPVVEDGASLAEIAAHPAVVLGDRAGVPPGSVATPTGGEWLVVTGPEGGLAPAEIEALAPAARVAVGAHVLRARTAPVALAAALAGRRGPEGPAPHAP